MRDLYGFPCYHCYIVGVSIKHFLNEYNISRLKHTGKEQAEMNNLI